MSARALACAEKGQGQACVAARSLTTLFYLLARHHSPDQARTALTSLMTFLPVAPVDRAVIEQALNLPYADFEDAVQPRTLPETLRSLAHYPRRSAASHTTRDAPRMMAAVRSGAQYLVARNVHR